MKLRLCFFVPLSEDNNALVGVVAHTEQILTLSDEEEVQKKKKKCVCVICLSPKNTEHRAGGPTVRNMHDFLVCIDRVIE